MKTFLKWAGGILCAVLILGAAFVAVSPTRRMIARTAWEVLEARRFKSRFEPPRVDQECSSYPAHRLGACFNDRARSESLLQGKSPVAKMLYLAVLAPAAVRSSEKAADPGEKMEVKLDLFQGISDAIAAETAGPTPISVRELRDQVGRELTAESEAAGLLEAGNSIRAKYLLTLLEQWERGWVSIEKYRSSHAAELPAPVLDRHALLQKERESLLTRFTEREPASAP